jgi:hypothetical protein
MACPQVADGGDGFQIWRVAAIIMNKQSWETPGKLTTRDPPAWLVGKVLTTLTAKETASYEMLHRVSD